MALVNFKQGETLAMLEADLLQSMEQEKFINIHIDSKLTELSYCIVPDDIMIDNCIMITSGSFELNIKLENTYIIDIQYSEIENGYRIQCRDMDVYFDFNS